MTEELVREMGMWVWDLGENGESIVEGRRGGREGARRKDEFGKEGV